MSSVRRRGGGICSGGKRVEPAGALPEGWFSSNRGCDSRVHWRGELRRAPPRYAGPATLGCLCCARGRSRDCISDCRGRRLGDRPALSRRRSVGMKSDSKSGEKRRNTAESPQAEPRIEINGQVLREVRQHARSSMSAEICGVLIGRVEGRMTAVTASIAGEEARQGGSHVTFTQDTWTHIYRVKDSRY